MPGGCGAMYDMALDEGPDTISDYPGFKGVSASTVDDPPKLKETDDPPKLKETDDPEPPKSGGLFSSLWNGVDD